MRRPYTPCGTSHGPRAASEAKLNGTILLCLDRSPPVRCGMSLARQGAAAREASRPASPRRGSLAPPRAARGVGDGTGRPHPVGGSRRKPATRGPAGRLPSQPDACGRARARLEGHLTLPPLPAQTGGGPAYGRRESCGPGPPAAARVYDHRGLLRVIIQDGSIDMSGHAPPPGPIGNGVTGGPESLRYG